MPPRGTQWSMSPPDERHADLRALSSSASRIVARAPEMRIHARRELVHSSRVSEPRNQACSKTWCVMSELSRRVRRQDVSQPPNEMTEHELVMPTDGAGWRAHHDIRRTCAIRGSRAIWRVPGRPYGRTGLRQLSAALAVSRRARWCRQNRRRRYSRDLSPARDSVRCSEMRPRSCAALARAAVRAREGLRTAGVACGGGCGRVLRTVRFHCGQDGTTGSSGRGSVLMTKRL
jgi:hypothetical protein